MGDRMREERDHYREKYLEQQTEIERLRQLINIDRTGLAHGLVEVIRLAKSCAWIAAGEWGSYEFDQHTIATLQTEVASLLNSLETIAVKALRESGQRADEAFHGTPMGVLAHGSYLSPELSEAVLGHMERGEDVPSIDELIERSSLGSPEAKAIRAGADPAVVQRVLDRADELAREPDETDAEQFELGRAFEESLQQADDTWHSSYGRGGKPYPETPAEEVLRKAEFMQRERADGVYGCSRVLASGFCGKPCALVGDVIPADGICPWCRGAPSKGADHVAALWLRDKRKPAAYEPPKGGSENG
jgi:hypothetical protein